MALGDARSTGRRRTRGINREQTQIRSGGLDPVSVQAATPKQLLTPNIQVPESNAIKLAESLSGMSKKLQAYQDRNQKRFASEAELASQAIVDRELAAGKSLEEIRAGFANNEYPELKTQLSYDVFNAVWGQRQAIEYFEDKDGEGYQKVEDWMKRYEAAPYHERQEMDIEPFIATLKDNFRNMVGDNPKLLAGAMTRIGKWSTETRNELNKKTGLLDEADKTNTASKNLLTHLKDSLQYNVMAVGVEGEDGPNMSYQDWAETVPDQIEVFFQSYSRNVNWSRANITKAKFAVIEDLLIDAQTKGGPQEKLLALDIAEKILMAKPNDQLPNMLKNNGLYNTETGGQTSVRNEAQNKLTQIQKLRNGLQEGINLDAVKQQFRDAVLSTGTEVPRILVGQENSDIQGTGKSRSYFINDAIQNAVNEYKSRFGDDTPQYFTAISNLAERFNNIPNMPQINELQTQIQEATMGIKEAVKQFKETGAKDQFTTDKMTQINQAYKFYHALKTAGKTGVMNRYFPDNSDTRRMFETLDSYQQTGMTSGGQVTKIEPETVAAATAALSNPAARLTNEDLAMYRTEIVEDLDGWWSDWLGIGNKDLDEASLSPQQRGFLNRRIEMSYRRLSARQFGSASELASAIADDVLRDTTVLFLDPKGLFNSKEVFIQASKGHPLHHDHPYRDKAQDAVNELINGLSDDYLKKEFLDRDDIGIAQVPDDPTLFFLQDSSGKAIPHPDNPNANVIFRIDGTGLLQREIRSLLQK